MYDYDELRKTHQTKISQTLDSPIMFADLWELRDILLSLISILVFGLIFYSWKLLILSLIWTLLINPRIKRNNNRGILIHWPYKIFGMGLRGLMNPKGNKRYSD